MLHTCCRLQECTEYMRLLLLMSDEGLDGGQNVHFQLLKLNLFRKRVLHLFLTFMKT